MNIQDKELLNELVLESREHLSAIEPDLLALEQSGAAVSDDIINRLFRAVHSIKGGFSFFGIEKVTRLAHAMENVMGRIRDKALVITPECVDGLLLGVDKLRSMLDDVGHAGSASIDEELRRLTPFLADGGGPAQALGPQGKLELDRDVRGRHPDVSDDRIFEALRHGKQVYEIVVYSQTDLVDKKLTPLSMMELWEKIGDVLDVTIDAGAVLSLAGSSRKNVPYSVLFATVLEPDLIGPGVGIPEQQINTLDMTKVKEAFKATHTASSEGADAPKKKGAEETGQQQAAKESKIEDALRVKVSLLNNLMNLAGELVLSRNQLMQSVNHKLSESLSTETAFKNSERTIERSCATVLDMVRRGAAGAEPQIAGELDRIQKAFSQGFDLRLVDLQGLRGILQNIDLVTSMLQENIMQTRLQPISIVFSKFPRVIRDLAKKCGKEANLTVIGQNVELDKSIVELLSDPLTHLIRNAVDHGIETPKKRSDAGKEPAGQIVLRAYHEGGKVNIEIQDDGAGINTSRVREKAIQLGLVKPELVAAMSDADMYQFIMAPGFSTAEVVSDVSGRGVGMDVVKTNIERLGGTVEIHSVPGEGTRFTLRLPLTLAIISSLMVTAEGRRFAVPQVNIEELVRVRSRDVTKKIEHIGGAEVFRLRNRLLPLVRLAAVLGIQPTVERKDSSERMPDQRTRWSDRRGVPGTDTEEPEAAPSAEEHRSGADRRTSVRNAVKIVVLRSGENLFGLVVDEVHDSEEIVVKPLSGYLKTCICYAGSTIMGDGTVSMILDANGLSRLANLNFASIESENAKEQARLEKATVASRKTDNLLLFTIGGTERFAIRLSDVARVEKVPTAKIQQVSDKEYLTYEEYSMRLIRLERYLPISRSTAQPEEIYVIVPKAAPQPLGIATALVDDVVNTEMAIDTKSVHGRGLLGSIIIGSNLTLLLDLPGLYESIKQEA
jgi:two-component system, chemotaxis family, sensor kinase CheA